MTEDRRKELLGKFERLLKQHNAFDRFVYYCYYGTYCNGSPIKHDMDYDRYIYKTARLERLLFYAFIWRETKEGHYFWKDINIEWKKLLQSIDKGHEFNFDFMAGVS